MEGRDQALPGPLGEQQLGTQKKCSELNLTGLLLSPARLEDGNEISKSAHSNLAASAIPSQRSLSIREGRGQMP